MTTCCHCGKGTGLRYYSLEKTIERISSVIPNSRPGQEQTALTYSVQVIFSMELEQYCNAHCWQAMEVTKIREHAIRYPYPEQHGLMATCSRCGQAFLATHPYMALNVMDLALDEKPWLTSAMVHFSETLARFCPDCEPPAGLATATTAIEHPPLCKALS